MKRLLLIMAIGLVPAAGMAQPYAAQQGDEPGFVAPLSTIGSGDHGVSTTETSPAKARSVRRNGQTLKLSQAGEPVQNQGGKVTRFARSGN